MNVYEARHAGREYCNTEGSEHYKGGEIEPIDLTNSLDLMDGFCIGNIIKYASRFKQTRNLDDLKKVSDYAHILCGVEMKKQADEKLEKAIDSFLVAKDFESIGKAKELCRESYIFDGCDACPIREESKNKQISCREYIEHYPELAVGMLGKAVD